MSPKFIQVKFKRHNVEINQSQDKLYAGCELNRIISACLLVLCLPIIVVNTLLALLQKKSVLQQVRHKDCLNRVVEYYHFSTGVMKNIAALGAVVSKRISLCGMPINIELTSKDKAALSRYSHIQAGFFDAITVHQSGGLRTVDNVVLLEKQFSGTRTSYLLLVLRGVTSQLIFKGGNSHLNCPEVFSLFGLKINNDYMADAINWVMTKPLETTIKQRCKVSFFVNVNSVNLAHKSPKLKDHINQADRCFSDGLGIRIAARKIGVQLKDNVNGTDMLPCLCKAAAAKGVSIYLLGGKPNVAKTTAQNLCQQYPGLHIAGSEHGYFEANHSLKVIERINESQADILLVAMGSPDQEKWLIQHSHLINCRTALAVGGLFDFYSGKISRAPLWMRELGMEWVWRLIQEPKAKFNRYIIGNPLFLIRTFILNQAS
ncbi:MAG: exopolysaccharide biosynthesis WecB/TagA/CpsF family protein [Psychroserpens sp.]|jgi:exopolysaccharide biosynthesis WecB/TagA/CpsF family protein